MGEFTRGHQATISEDPDAVGGAVLACTVPACTLRREGPEHVLIGLAMDHYDDTLAVDA